MGNITTTAQDLQAVRVPARTLFIFSYRQQTDGRAMLVRDETSVIVDFDNNISYEKPLPAESIIGLTASECKRLGIMISSEVQI